MRTHLLIDVPLAASAISASLAYGSNIPLAIAGSAALLMHSWATFHPRSSLYMPVQWRLPSGEDGFALTFDDGPHPEYTPAILDLLAEHDQRATFFLIGEHAKNHGALVRRIRAEGHAIGLHSHSHSRWFNCWPPKKVRSDLERCAQTISDATGEAAPRWFRPPVGLKNPLVAEVCAGLGLHAVTWSGRAWDTRSQDPKRIAAAIDRSARPRAIVLLHDGHEPGRPADRAHTVTALKMALPALAARGMRSRALPAL